MIQTSQRSRFAAGLALLLISLAYLMQIASPLRLVGDGVDYLLQASSAADGYGFRVHGEKSMRPPGYPALIFLLLKAGIGKSWAIVALNCLLLGTGCWVSYFVLRSSFGFGAGAAEIICLLTLLSFVMVKHVTQPLSDICFFGASMSCLLLLLRAEEDTRPGRYWRLAIAAPLLMFCIELRTIGIALIPAFAWVMVGGAPSVRRVPHWGRQHRVASLVLLLLLFAAIALAGSMFLHSRYLQFNAKTLHRRGVLGNFIWDLKDHTLEWGELAVNAPVSKLPGGLKLPLRIAGFCTLVLAATGIWEKRRKLDAPVWYVLGFASIVLAYPWFDARLWLPVLSFVDGVCFYRGEAHNAVRCAAACDFGLLFAVLPAGDYCARLQHASDVRWPAVSGSLRGRKPPSHVSSGPPRRVAEEPR